MTTGRINQVTILLAGAWPGTSEKPTCAETHDSIPPRRGGQKLVNTKAGTDLEGARGTSRTTPDRRPHHPREEAAVDHGHPIAPTEFPKGWSVATLRSVPGGTTATL